MGMDINGTHSLLYARTVHVDFERTATIGRQSLNLSWNDLKHALQAFGYVADKKLINQIFKEGNGYAEPLFSYLGARTVHSIDYSDYEGATHLWDLNQAIPSILKGQYSVVVDGGSLEHVFNFPMAIKNCMEMVSVGGHFLSLTPANNSMGHGFYQFSPDLFFRVFTRENGFSIIRIVAFERKPRATWYLVSNPEEIKERVSLINGASSVPIYLLIIAKRLSETTIFKSTPYQSDYWKNWHEQKAGSAEAVSNILEPTKQNILLRRIKRGIPSPLKRVLRKIFKGPSSPFDNTRYFRPFDPTTEIPSDKSV